MKSIAIALFFISSFAFGQGSDFSHIDFKKADSIALLYKGESLENLPVLTHSLTADLTTDVEKFRAIYTWVSTNIENDYSSYLKTRKKRKKLSGNQEALLAWNNSFTPKVFENLLKHNKTACTGYAYLIRELARLAEIHCEIINGFGRTATLILTKNSIPNHSWNAVKLDSKWYLCDSTWSAGQVIIEEQGARFESDYYDGYFLADPSLFIKNHFPLEKDWSLLAQPPSFKTFLEGPVVYKEAFSPTIIPTTPSQMHLEIVKNEEISFTLNSIDTLDGETIFLVLNTMSGSKSIQPKVVRNNDDYVLQHTFEQAGKYDVHLKVADAIIATYVVRVRRNK